jgi:hypothetical protein
MGAQGGRKGEAQGGRKGGGGARGRRTAGSLPRLAISKSCLAKNSERICAAARARTRVSPARGRQARALLQQQGLQGRDGAAMAPREGRALEAAARRSTMMVASMAPAYPIDHPVGTCEYSSGLGSGGEPGTTTKPLPCGARRAQRQRSGPARACLWPRARARGT